MLKLSPSTHVIKAHDNACTYVIRECKIEYCCYKSVNTSFCFVYPTVLTLFCINNNSFAIEQTIINEGKFNNIDTADVSCSIRAQENNKNIEKLNSELFLVAGELYYKKTPECWFYMTKKRIQKLKKQYLIQYALSKMKSIK